jgi:MoaA/NifB/PqqE/SkfB family radical SAM enzyme
MVKLGGYNILWLNVALHNKLLVIDEKVFLSFLKKLKEKGVKEVKVSRVYIDGEWKDLKVLKIEDVERAAEKADRIYYDTKKEKISVGVVEIDDENFDEIKKMAIAEYVIKQL